MTFYYLLFAILGLIWGVNFLFLKWAMDFITAEQAVFLRVLFGMIPLFFMCISRKILKFEHLKNWVHIFVMALTANVVNFYFIAKGTKLLGAGLSGGISGIIPLCASVLAFMFLSEKVTVKKILGLVIGLFGVLMISEFWHYNFFCNDMSGIIYMLIASFVYSISFVWAKKYLTNEKIPTTALAFYQTVFAVLILGCFTNFAGIENILTNSKALWGMVIGLGFLGTGIAYIIYYKLIENLGISIVSTVTYIPPIVALMIGFGLGENISNIQLVGTAVILLGVFLNKQD